MNWQKYSFTLTNKFIPIFVKQQEISEKKPGWNSILGGNIYLNIR